MTTCADEPGDAAAIYAQVAIGGTGSFAIGVRGARGMHARVKI